MMNDSSGASAARRPRASGTLGRAGRACTVVAGCVECGRGCGGACCGRYPPFVRTTDAARCVTIHRRVLGDSDVARRASAVRGRCLARGSVSAPVVVAEWGDFQCPFCRAFDLDSQPVLIGDYVQTGKVRFEWHDLAKLVRSRCWPRAARAQQRARGVLGVSRRVLPRPGPGKQRGGDRAIADGDGAQRGTRR